ncbi:gamma-glutamylcyclotransferase family protein [Microbacterium immunditiarum]|uniref:Gamma-glutamylcyclotransferase (GGCT)/AIG2-like uncharacterized protein YtfP n=1 Tax=Microbacterium immunditiarum TaxID=337480 RepID=A0A7Y9GNC2_9MICO|nr:gamma-glutamylcyclotransferase family protein [Microbacterium immunditiarum]NYE19699.1 gamma-glutamylcyclotransferase (GGCT)/AIG2-like uncharacterized protein YtfP [Microbacterium immunditiarum]
MGAVDDDGDERAGRAEPGPRSIWLRPSGISALAAVAAVAVALIGVLVTLQPSPASGPQASTPADRPALFVYGSSMPGQSRYDVIAEHVLESRPDAVEGFLYDSGLGYPLAKFGPGAEVPGVVLYLHPETADDVLRAMTQVESGLFHPRQVRTQGGVTATAYEWIGATDGFPRIDEWDGSTADYGLVVDESSLVPGDCYGRTARSGEALTTLCDAPHAYEVYAVVDPGDDTQAACEDEFATFAGLPYSDSVLVVETVESGSGVNCIVFEPDVLTSGTLAGARR